MDRYERIKDCPCMKFDKDKLICSKKELLHSTKEGCEMHLIGYNEAGQLMAVCGYDWTIVKMRADGSFEHAGTLDKTLRAILDEPELLLTNAKIMTVDEISRKLGYTVIVRESRR